MHPPHPAHPRRCLLLTLAAAAALPLAALAHGDGHTGASAAAQPVAQEQKAWGIAGDRAAARRTVRIAMSDRMRFTPDTVKVTLGETVRFVFRNEGKTLHEFVLGTRASLEEHAALMMKFPGMEHDDPWMAHVPPGKTAEIVWTFNRPGQFDFGCLVAGHFQSGMSGRVEVLARR